MLLLRLNLESPQAPRPTNAGQLVALGYVCAMLSLTAARAAENSVLCPTPKDRDEYAEASYLARQAANSLFAAARSFFEIAGVCDV